MNPPPPPPLPFSVAEIPNGESREWLLAAFGYYLRYFQSAAVDSVDLFDEEKPAHSRDCLEEAIRLFVLQELAMLASIGWSLRLKDGAAVRFCLNAEVVDEEGNNLQSIVINRDTLKFLPDYWEDWEEGCFPWK